MHGIAEIPYRTPFRLPVSELKASVACYLFLAQFTPTDTEVRVSGRIVNDFSSLADCGFSPSPSASPTRAHTRATRSRAWANVEPRHVDHRITMRERTRRGHLKVIKSCNSIASRI
jgi:hypothetical protein